MCLMFCSMRMKRWPPPLHTLTWSCEARWLWNSPQRRWSSGHCSGCCLYTDKTQNGWGDKRKNFGRGPISETPKLVFSNELWHPLRGACVCVCEGAEKDSPPGSCTHVCVYVSLSLDKAQRGRALAIWRFLFFSVSSLVCITWLISLVHAAFSCREGASNTTVNEAESAGSTTSLKSSWPNTCAPALAGKIKKHARGVHEI